MALFDKSLIDEVFPHKDKDGRPMFRVGQREAIEAVIDAFNGGFKYVAIDGKTGCGKSVINYTVAMCCQGKSTYLAPMKSLQDQVASEGWPDMSVLKGKSGYSCNHCQDLYNMEYRCDYEGDHVLTCNNSTPEVAVNKNLGGLRDSIVKYHEELKDSKLLMFKSSFSSIEQFDTEIDNITKDKRDFVYSQLLLSDENPEKLAKFKKVPMSKLEKIVDEEVYDCVGCSMSVCECPNLSAKSISNVKKINVLNPDVMYYINSVRKNSRYSESDLLIVDEAHGFEDVMQRIFSSSVPVDFIKDVYGIDIMDVITGPTSVDKEKWSNLVMIENTLSVLKKFSSIMMIHNLPSRVNLCRSKGSIAVKYCKRNFVYTPGSVSPLSLVLSIIMGENSDDDIAPFVNKYSLNKIGFVSLDDIIMSISGYLGNDIHKIKTKRLNDFSLNAEQMLETMVHTEFIIYEYLMVLHNIIRDFVVNTNKLFSSSDIEFIFNETDAKLGSFVSSKMFDNTDRKTKVMSSIIVSPGSLANRFFYDTADHVLLTTGTWVYYNSILRSLGLDCDKTFFYQIPSTFDVKRRPTYIMNKPIENFSKKNDNGQYVYETTEGRTLYVSKLISLIDSMQTAISDKTGLPVNVIVHTNSFKIAKHIAEYGKFDMDEYVFHLNEQVINVNTHIKPTCLNKELFMIEINSNPDSGMVFISPSVTEGVDFKNGLARAQIILKHPMPNFGDPYISALLGNINIPGLKLDLDIYKRKTYTTLAQQYGRVMRSDEDWGYTLIADGKSVIDITYLLRSGRDRKDANMEYMLNSIPTRLSCGKMVYLNPSFAINY